MRAVKFDRYGDEDVLEVRDVDPPEAGPGQLIVAVRAAGINPGEAKIREGALDDRWPATFPEGEGSDLAGVIDSVGPDVSGFAVGDEVFGYTNNRASHAELVLVGADEIVAKPAEVPWEVAGGLFIAGTSAYALVDAVHPDRTTWSWCRARPVGSVRSPSSGPATPAPPSSGWPARATTTGCGRTTSSR